MRKMIRFGVIGAGLMGREFASASLRWPHLLDLPFAPRIVAVCDPNPQALNWFKNNVPTMEATYIDYNDLLSDPSIDAVYCAVPHNLHKQIYIDIIQSGKHLLGEKPFGIDLAANQSILHEITKRPNLIIRCSSEFPFFPGAYRIAQYVQEHRFGKIIEVEAGFWHSSDLDPNKRINWKRRIETNGEYGCMGDLGIHVVHLPFRFGWFPHSIRALLSNIVPERPDKDNHLVPCETWDNAILSCDVKTDDQNFPMMLSTKRIAPGHNNTWFLRITGTEFSAEYSTKFPKQIMTMPFRSGQEQAWQITDLKHKSAYDSITGEIFEFGFSDSILQMWASFCDEIINRDAMRQPMRCLTPNEAAWSHKLFTAALESNKTGQTVLIHH